MTIRIHADAAISQTGIRRIAKGYLGNAIRVGNRIPHLPRQSGGYTDGIHRLHLAVIDRVRQGLRSSRIPSTETSGWCDFSRNGPRSRVNPGTRPIHSTAKSTQISSCRIDEVFQGWDVGYGHIEIKYRCTDIPAQPIPTWPTSLIRTIEGRSQIRPLIDRHGRRGWTLECQERVSYGRIRIHKFRRRTTRKRTTTQHHGIPQIRCKRGSAEDLQWSTQKDIVCKLHAITTTGVTDQTVHRS